MAQQPFRSFLLLEVARIRPCTSLRWTLALYRLEVFSRRTLMSWCVLLSLATQSQSKITAKGSASGGSARAVDCRKGMSTLVWASAAREKGNFCVLSSAWCEKFRKRPVITVESSPSGKRIETNASPSTRASQILLSRRWIWSRSPRDNPSSG